MKDKKKQRSLLESYTFYTRIPAIILTIAIAITFALVILEFFFPNIGFLIGIAAVVFFAFILYITYFMFIRSKLKLTFFDQIYKTTFNNLNKIKNNDSNLSSYGESDNKEINILDETTSDISKKLNSS